MPQVCALPTPGEEITADIYNRGTASPMRHSRSSTAASRIFLLEHPQSNIQIQQHWWR